MTDNAKIVNQLRALVLLTQTEEQVARTRVSQARTDAVRRELIRRNARRAPLPPGAEPFCVHPHE